MYSASNFPLFLYEWVWRIESINFIWGYWNFIYIITKPRGLALSPLISRRLCWWPITPLCVDSTQNSPSHCTRGVASNCGPACHSRRCIWSPTPTYRFVCFEYQRSRNYACISDRTVFHTVLNYHSGVSPFSVVSLLLLLCFFFHFDVTCFIIECLVSFWCVMFCSGAETEVAQHQIFE